MVMIFCKRTNLAKIMKEYIRILRGEWIYYFIVGTVNSQTYFLAFMELSLFNLALRN
jgi:hypothetical protein